MSDLILLPYYDFTASAIVFTNRDLVLIFNGVYNTVSKVSFSEDDHRQIVSYPAKAWVGYEPQLIQYGFALAEEINSRRIRHLVKDMPRKLEELQRFLTAATSGSFTMHKPKWCYDFRVLESHQAFLMRSDSLCYNFHSVDPNTTFAWE